MCMQYTYIYICLYPHSSKNIHQKTSSIQKNILDVFIYMRDSLWYVYTWNLSKSTQGWEKMKRSPSWRVFGFLGTGAGRAVAGRSVCAASGAGTVLTSSGEFPSENSGVSPSSITDLSVPSPTHSAAAGAGVARAAVATGRAVSWQGVKRL